MIYQVLKKYITNIKTSATTTKHVEQLKIFIQNCFIWYGVLEDKEILP